MNSDTLIPRHVGFILDGHRRWAKEQGLPTLEGHRQGYQNFKDIGLRALELGVEFATAYVWSKENWKRSTEEVSYIMKLILWVAKNELESIHKKNVRIRFLGNAEGLTAEVKTAMQQAETVTEKNTGGTLGLCLNYTGQEEIVDAARSLIRAGADPDSLTVEAFAEHLYVPEIPPIDLIIRSSGEQRLSGFMLWRAAYAEFYFTQKNWPDFTRQDFDAALEDYSQRHRRYGQ